MKKLYITPECEIIVMETEECLCISVPVEGDADGPANIGEYLIDFDDEE